MTPRGSETATGRLRLSVIIVNYRSWEPLARCLESLPYGLAGGLEVVVVDNASGDGRLPHVRAAHAGATFLASAANRGFAAGCNLGARAARGRWLLFLNPDARDPDGRQIERLLARAEAGDAAIVTCRQVDERGRGQKVFDLFPGPTTVLPSLRALRRVLAPHRWPDARRCRAAWRRVPWVSGSALLIRREVLDQLGGWSERYFMYSEDVDLCRRATNAGHDVAFTGEATLVHAHGAASRVDAAVAAFTRAETTLSRHIYVGTHLRGARAAITHTLLFATRSLPTLLLALLARPLPPAIAARRRAIARRLTAGYRRRWRTGAWQASTPPAGPPSSERLTS